MTDDSNRHNLANFPRLYLYKLIQKNSDTVKQFYENLLLAEVMRLKKDVYKALILLVPTRRYLKNKHNIIYIL